MRIQHNIMALNAYRQLGGNNSALAKNLEKLSSGYRINRAGDDAAGLAISEKMRAQIKGLEAAQKNANDGISLVQTAEGALTEVHSMLNRMVYLATQSANGTYDNEVDRANLDKEVQTLKEEINRISQSTNFNGLKLLDGSMDSATKTTNNAMSDSFKIADWVGSLDNETAIVGTGTIVHSDSKEAKATSFAIELNNSTVSGENGVKLTLGEGDDAVVMELTKDEIANGASAEDVAKAMAEKYKDGINFKGADGNDVLFNVTAEGDSIKLEQADAPANAGQVVNASMKLTTEGLGMPDGTKDPDRLNNTLPTIKDITKDTVQHQADATGSFSWQNGITDEDKDALNKILEGNDNASVKYSYTNTATTDTAATGTRKVDVSKLQEALGADYEIVVEEAGATKTIDATGVAALSDNAGPIDIKIVKAGSKDPIGTLRLNGAVDGTDTNDFESTISLNAGNNQTKNVAPTISVEDKGNIGAKDADVKAAKFEITGINLGGTWAANDTLKITSAGTDALNMILKTDGTTWSVASGVPAGWTATLDFSTPTAATVTLTRNEAEKTGVDFGAVTVAKDTSAAGTVTGGTGALTDGVAPLFKLKDGLTEAQLTALNDAIGKDGQTITLQYEKLNGNEAAANTSVLKATLGQGLADAGYYLATDTADPSGADKYDADDGLTSAGKGAGNDDMLYLYDKDNNLIGTITTNSDTATNLTSDPTTISLKQSTFNKEATVTATNGDGNVAKGADVFKAATPADPNDAATDLSNVNFGTNTALTAEQQLKDGDSFSFEIGGKTYTITAKNGGLNPEDAKSGKFLDISGTNAPANGADLLSKLETELKKQVALANAESAKGTESYTEYSNIRLTANANNAARIDITADTTEYVAVDDAAADDPTTPGDTTTGGKDWNAATVKQTQGNAASTGRLASTYITADDLAGLKDGSQMVIGGKTYTFAVGKDSKVTGDNVVDLKHLEVGNEGLAGEALKELYKVTTAAGDNEMFSTGFDGTKLTFTENKEYKWGEGVDLSTKDGIAEQFGFYADGMTSTTNGKALTLQVGDTADSYQKVGLDIKDMSTEGLDIADIDIKTQENAAAAIDKIKAAINTVSSQRGDLGAIQNRLEHTINNLGVQAENITAAESRIRDTDMAEEMMAYTKNNILIQAAQAMLAQANQVPQGILQLLQ